jgi:NAD+ synthase
MKTKLRIKTIVSWIGDYVEQNNINTLVVGVSGGIDSAVVSTLCAKTGVPTIAVSMPIRQSAHTHDLSQRHLKWLNENFRTVESHTYDLTPTFDSFEKIMGQDDSELAFANSRARIRMTCLYQVAQTRHGIVVGTGNKVEDFGVGFFTKYGDGGVDISPIGDCVKTEVWDMGRELGIIEDIIKAAPTDGLWADGRTDEDQLGMTYFELEQAMLDDQSKKGIVDTERRRRWKQYRRIRARNLHKMLPIPVCELHK